MTRSRLEHAVAIAILFAGVLIAFSSVLGPDTTLALRDHANVFQPRWWWIRQALARGMLPSLTHASPDGFPMEGMLNGTYTPLLFTIFFGPFDAAYDWLVISHFLVLASGTYLLAIVLGARPWEAAASAAAATLAGPIFSFENLVVALSGIAFAPWVFAALVAFVRAPSLPRAGVLAIATGFQLQGLIPVTAILDVVALVLVLVHLGRRLDARVVGLGLFAAVLALGIASLGLMPALQLLPATQRGQGFSYAIQSQWSFRWDDFFELFFPSLWWQPDLPFSALNFGHESSALPFLHSLYLGSVLPIAAAGLAHRSLGRARWFIVGVFVLAFLVALGPATPLHRLASRLPILASDRFPIKFLLLDAAILALLVPLGLRVEAERARPIMLGVALLHVVLAIGLGVFFLGPEIREAVQGAVQSQVERFTGLGPENEVELVMRGLFMRLGHGFFAAVALVLALLLHARSKAPVLPVSLVLVILTVDLAFAARTVIVGVSRDPAISPLELAAGRATPQHRLVALVPGGASAAEVYWSPKESPAAASLLSARLRGENAYRAIRKYEWVDRNGQGQPLFFLPGRLLRFSAGPDDPLRLLGRAGVAWISTPTPEQREALQTFSIDGEPPQYLFPNPFTRPLVRAYLRWRTVALDQMPLPKAAELLGGEGTWDTAFVAPSIGPRIEAPDEASTATCAEPRVGSVSVEDGAIEAEVESPCPTLLVTLEPYAAPWQLEVDGRPSPILMAEAGFLAAHVLAGHHAIRFVYAPLSELWRPVSLGAFLAALACVALGLGRARRAGG